MAATFNTMFASFNNCTTSAAGTSVRVHNGLDTVLLAVSIIVSLNIGILGINV